MMKADVGQEVEIVNRDVKNRIPKGEEKEEKKRGRGNR